MSKCVKYETLQAHQSYVPGSSRQRSELQIRQRSFFGENPLNLLLACATRHNATIGTSKWILKFHFPCCNFPMVRGRGGIQHARAKRKLGRYESKIPRPFSLVMHMLKLNKHHTKIDRLIIGWIFPVFYVAKNRFIKNDPWYVTFLF